MRFIPTYVHAILDYATAIVLIALPFVFYDVLGREAIGPTGAWTLVFAGLLVLVASIMTRYELGAFKIIPMPVHLGLDALVGVFLIVSPWLFGFADVIWWPHVLVGLAEIGAAFLTKKEPRVRVPGR